MVCVTGVPLELPYAPWFLPVKFNFFAPYGEAFWVPWYSKDGQASWSCLFEAKEGGPLDRFRDCKSAEETWKVGREVIREMMPWDYEMLRDAVPCDDNAWLVGQFTPEIRQVVGTLPSGAQVMALGDTAQSLDPIGGQGANNGNKMTQTYVQAIEERGELPFDADWMRSTFDRFWQRHHYINDFNNTLLEPLTPAGRMLLIAQYGSDAKEGNTSGRQKIADLFIRNFNDPILLTEAFHDKEKASEVIREACGSPRRALARGVLGVAAAQVRQKVGLPAGHPGT